MVNKVKESDNIIVLKDRQEFITVLYPYKSEPLFKVFRKPVFIWFNLSSENGNPLSHQIYIFNLIIIGTHRQFASELLSKLEVA